MLAWYPFVALVAVLISLPSALSAQAPAVPGEVLVGMRAQADSAPGAARATRPFGQVLKRLPGLRAYRIKLHPGVVRDSAIRKLREQPGIEYVEPNWIRSIHADPDDPDYLTRQYGPQ